MQPIALYCPDTSEPSHQSLLQTCQALDWIDIQPNQPSDQAFILIDNGQLSIASSDWPKVHAVSVDFLSSSSEHRRLYGGGAGQAVCKAVGLKKRKHLTILDATAGLARDSFVMASQGATVYMFERHPVVNLLLQNGLERLSASELTDLSARLTLLNGSLLNLGAVAETVSVDVVYLDPMFPDRSKSAKVKKDMAIFHQLVGADADADSLLAPALALANYRVVVKRPKNAPWLDDKKPSTALIGKSSRFDIYAKKALTDD
ncbi:class I SAM-dependent methyltransferase [Reinekea thalattae]|uniref:Ribosomal RNA small subunit methyltransferase J n=1 Tax=Reinekea thalattae TaxID=2593301 RepID=A0A5C8Z9F4_9GAMM|nr:class I SAM-dependent methyltransferase [Reinekea thalattae]TXR53781.1 16S rRNA methyltransferase [Reinekea thalattae]